MAAGAHDIMRVIARFACFIARRASRGKGLLHDLGQLAHEASLLESQYVHFGQAELV